ncbi:hypothetical protein OCU04_003036 [Sclerotinia nivalis]|uniref:MYND-type zinc finger protein samB n=1 Tax=Sclerotinia nivalis TaxID=352851 RepID=A0A9X0AUV0_9HELO|nr:hypothetical protein OCU04_003036 [Sclerotinia nivalis]
MVNPKYALQDVPGKGKGLVAAQEIPEGTRILEERLIMTRPKQAHEGFSLRNKVNALNEAQRQAFLSLANVHPYKDADQQYLGIFKTNGLPMGIHDQGGLFIETSRINHACNNNACHSWNTNIERMTVHALRNIQKGEEITLNYLGSRLFTRKVRLAVLKEKFKFLCSCDLCCLPPEQSRQNYRELKEIYRGMTLVPRAFVRFPLQAIRYLDQTVQLLSGKEFHVSSLCNALAEAFELNLGQGDLARARVLAEKAMRYMSVIYGSDSPAVLDNRRRANHPSMSDIYGLSSQEWATAIDDVPSGVKSDEFEGWVWRREGLQDSRLFSYRPNSFLSHSIFPAFDDLPHERKENPDFYENVGTSTCRPRRHWCFLGEIMEFETRPPHKIQVENVDGIRMEVKLILDTDAQGNSPAPTQLQKGHTVAILYAQRCGDDSEPEISLKNAALLQIFPISLHNLIALRDVTQEFSTKGEIDNARICHACGKKSASMAKCRRCSFFWYCNRNCQVAGWNKKGHKNDCKILSDPNLRGMFVMKWDEFNGVVQFPLSDVGN